MKFYGAEMEGVTLLENRTADPPQYIDERDGGRLFYNQTERVIRFGAEGIFKSLDIPVGTIMMFGQPNAPAGWTKKTDWQNNSMLVFTNEDFIHSGGDTDATASLIIASDGTHTHTIDSHTHSITGESITVDQMPVHSHTQRGSAFTYGPGGALQYQVASGPANRGSTLTSGSGDPHDHGGATGSSSGGTTENGAHTHSINSPYYQTVIAAVKD